MTIQKIFLNVLLLTMLCPNKLLSVSLAFLPSSNYQYSDTCVHNKPFCPYGDLWVKFQYQDGSLSPVQSVACGTIGQVTPDPAKGTPSYVILSGHQHATVNYQSKFSYSIMADLPAFASKFLTKLTPVVTTCSEHSGNPKFAIAGIDESKYSDVLAYRLRNGIPFGTNMWDFDPDVFKKIASCG